IGSIFLIFLISMITCPHCYSLIIILSLTENPMSVAQLVKFFHTTSTSIARVGLMIHPSHIAHKVTTKCTQKIIITGGAYTLLHFLNLYSIFKLLTQNLGYSIRKN
ncbi:hypothetical protein ACJX0J_020242, partial [Zea mays]